MSSDPLVRCTGVSKTYFTASGALEALHSVDAEFASGSVTAVVGASGSGKSTLLRAISGLDRPTRGVVLVRGSDIARASARRLRRHRQQLVTYISQKPAENLFPQLTLAEHAHDAGRDASALLERVGLAHRLSSEPIELSGGEQARAAFALALARKTPLVVIDEPTAELDRQSAAPLLAAIREAAAAGVAIVVATHDPDVTAIADGVLRLDRGRVVATEAAPPVSSVDVLRVDGAGVVLRANGISKAYRHGDEIVHALRDVSFELQRGELAVLLGRSGSGKSTLLTVLAGWQPPDGGELEPPRGPASVAWGELGYLPQRFGLIPELTVRENVELPARLTGTRDELASRLIDILRRFGLDELAERTPPETSIGQQQRTALARALLLRPPLLLADEPTSHQDAGWRDAVWQELVHAARDGTTCLIATHDEYAAAHATRVFQITGGTITDD